MKEYGAASSELTDNKMMVSWKVFEENVINNFKNEGFDFSQILFILILEYYNSV